jgi:hypothetical protein
MGDNALLVVMPEKPERQLRVGSVEQEPGSIQSRKKNNTPEESQQRRKKEEYMLLCVHAPAARGAP